MAAAAGAIVLAIELFQVTDVLGHGRLNSVFKFWWPVWPLLAVAGAVGVALAWDRAPKPRLAVEAARARPRALALTAMLGVAILLWLGALLYAPAAAVSRAQEGQERTLDALAYLEVRDHGRGGGTAAGCAQTSTLSGTRC